MERKWHEKYLLLTLKRRNVFTQAFTIQEGSRAGNRSKIRMFLFNSSEIKVTLQNIERKL